MKQLYVKPVSLCLAAVSVWLLGACTSETPDTSHEVKAISFNTPQTRAAIEDPSGMKAFSVWGWYRNTTTGGSPVSVFDNTTVTQSSGWNYEGGTRYWIPGNTYNFYAVHPVGLANALCTDEGILSITNFDCSTNTDLMIASRPQLTSEEGIAQGVQLNFSHLLARIEVSAKRHSATVDIEGFKPQVTSVKLYGMSKTANFKADTNDVGNINMASWTIGDTPTTGDSPLAELPQPVDITSSQELSVMDVLLFPQLVEKEFYLEITFSTDGGMHTKPIQKVQLTSLPVTQWEAGKHYHYSFTISADDRILFEKPTVTEWDEAVGGIIIVD